MVGVDLSPEMLEEAHRQSERAGIGNTTWFAMNAEEISDLLGRFWLITPASSFRWIRRDEVLDRTYGPLSWEEANVAYYASPERAAVHPDPAQYIAEARHHLGRPVQFPS